MEKFGLAQPFRRVEDPRLLRARGRYTDDIAPEGTLHAVVVRSPHAHAEIRGIATGAARCAPGVAGVFISADLAGDGLAPLPVERTVTNRDGSQAAQPPHFALATDRVRHVRDPVALVVAATRHAAQDAAALVRSDFTSVRQRS